MANHAELVKKVIAGEFEKMLRLNSFSDIFIMDLVTTCGISRNTFYYYFKDKYDLMNHIAVADIASMEARQTEEITFGEVVLSVCGMMFYRRKFYYPCLQYSGQNSLYEFLNEYFATRWLEIVSSPKTFDETDEMSTDKLVAGMKSFAVVGKIKEWVKMGMTEKQFKSFEKIRDILNDEAACYQFCPKEQYTVAESREMKIVS